MGQLLDRILAASTAHDVKNTSDGVLIIRRPGHRLGFDALARLLIDKAGAEYAAFPIADRRLATSYERVYVIPLD